MGPAAVAHPGRDRPGAAHGGAVSDGDERRAAVRAAGAALHYRGPAVGGHRLHPGVRQPAAARRPAGRPAGPQGHVPGRPGRVRWRLGHRRRLGQLHHADHRAGLPGRVRRAAGALGAVAADHHVHRAEGPRPGVRRLRRDRRGRRRGGPAAGRRADRVPVLAVDAVREPDLRRGGPHRRSAAAATPAVPEQAQAGHSRRAAGLRRPVLPGLRLLQRGRAQLARAVHLGVPPNRGGAYASMLIASAGLFGIFLFLTYYLQQTLGYSPLVTGVAFLPLSAGLILAANLSTTVLMPRFGPKPLVACGMLAAAGAMVWLAQLGPHPPHSAGVLGPTILAGIGVGLVIAPVINTGTFGVAPQDAGVASATVTVGQQLGASVGTSLLNTIFTAAVTSYLAAHLAAARLIGRPALTGLALAHGYDTAFWWTAG